MKIKLKRRFHYGPHEGVVGQIVDFPAVVADLAISIGAATTDLADFPPVETKKPAKK